VTSSSATFISLIGFSEFLALLPVVNMDYTPGLKEFFKGISGLNFQMFSFGSYFEWIPLPVSFTEREQRFSNAGFDSQSFILGSADAIFTFMVMALTMGVYILLNKCTSKKRGKKRFSLENYKYNNFI